MIKIGLGSTYFAARNAGSAGSPATLTITFGDGVDGTANSWLLVNGIQYRGPTFGLGGINVGYSDVELGTFDPVLAESIASEFQTTINEHYIYSTILTASRIGNIVTLATKATGAGASLYFSCDLYVFPNAPFIGPRYEVTRCRSRPGSSYVVGSGAESLFMAVSKTSIERWMFVLKISGSDSIAPSYSNYTHQVTVDLTSSMTSNQVSIAIHNAAIAAGLNSTPPESIYTFFTASELGNLIDGVSPFETLIETDGVGLKKVNITLRKTSGLVSSYSDNYKLYSGTTLLYDSDWDYAADLVWSNVTASNANTLTVVTTLNTSDSNNPNIISLTNNTCGAAINKSLPYSVTDSEPFNLTSFTSNGNVQINFTTSYSP